jgi:hypothetical protein
MKLDCIYSHHKTIDGNDVFTMQVYVGYLCIAEVSREGDTFEVAFHAKSSEHFCDINDFEQAALILKEHFGADDDFFISRVSKLAQICCCVYGREGDFFFARGGRTVFRPWRRWPRPVNARAAPSGSCKRHRLGRRKIKSLHIMKKLKPFGV